MTEIRAVDMPVPKGFAAYRLRWKRRRLLWRALRARHQLSLLQDHTKRIRPDDVLVFLVLRNESSRLPHFMEYYRRLGAGHFLIVDNDSTDGSTELLQGQQDVSLWKTLASYKASRFGLDWSNWLLLRYGHGHWCLTVDADELLAYDGMAQHDLLDLTHHLDQRALTGFGALMLDLYPKGPLSEQAYHPGQDPLEVLRFFDPGPYRARRQTPMGNLWMQGGVRERVFFKEEPKRSPTLNKIPLMRWHRRFAYVNSTHSLLPPRLNALYEGPGGTAPSGALLHTKFLPEIVSKSAAEKQRQQHFHSPVDFDHYYDGLASSPNLWSEKSAEYKGTEQLRDLGLLPKLDWGQNKKS